MRSRDFGLRLRNWTPFFCRNRISARLSSSLMVRRFALDLANFISSVTAVHGWIICEGQSNIAPDHEEGQSDKNFKAENGEACPQVDSAHESKAGARRGSRSLWFEDETREISSDLSAP